MSCISQDHHEDWKRLGQGSVQFDGEIIPFWPSIPPYFLPDWERVKSRHTGHE